MTKKRQLARRFGISNSMISYICNGDRYTQDQDLAIAIGELMGVKPINFIHPKLRKVYLKAFSGLGKIPKK